MSKSLFQILAPEQHAIEILVTIKNTVPTGDELFEALRNKSSDYGRVYLRKIQKEIEKTNHGH